MERTKRIIPGKQADTHYISGFARHKDALARGPLDSRYERITWHAFGHDARTADVVALYPPCGVRLMALFDKKTMRSAFQKLGTHAYTIQAALHLFNAMQEKKASRFILEIERHLEKQGKGEILVVKYAQFDDKGNYVYGKDGVPNEKDRGTLVVAHTKEGGEDVRALMDSLIEEGHANVTYLG